jgi:hypothetical protein
LLPGPPFMIPEVRLLGFFGRAGVSLFHADHWHVDDALFGADGHFGCVNIVFGKVTAFDGNFGHVAFFGLLYVTGHKAKRGNAACGQDE